MRITLLLLLLFITPWGWATHPGAYTFGVFPHMPSNRLIDIYQPFAMRFGAQLGQLVQLQSRPTFSAFRQALSEEEYDLALIQPFDYPAAYAQYNYLPLVRRSSDLRAILVVRSESTIQGVDDLWGISLAAPPEEAAVVRLMHAYLQQQGLDLHHDLRLSLKSNHFSCLQSVLLGYADGCITSAESLERFDDARIRGRLRIVVQSAPARNALIVAHKRLPTQERERLVQEILSWSETSVGREILSRGHMDPFVRADDHDYDLVRQLMAQE